MAQVLKRTWAEVRLDAVEHNYRQVRRLVGNNCRVMAVVKADAYGHGDVQVAKTLQEAGADWFGVSNLEEAVRLRRAGIVRPMLILSYTPPEEAVRLAQFDITQTVISADYARRLSEAAVAADVTVQAHIKLDTGMSRVGFFYQDADADAVVIDEIEAVCGLPKLTVQGIFTHFASADEEEGEAFTRRQHALFTEAITRLEQRGIVFAIKHCCNSAATLRFADLHMDMVRPGIVLYGLAPSAFLKDVVPLVPAMSVKTVVSQVKHIPAGTAVSYGRTYTAESTRTVATVPIGYADGYPRLLSNAAQMLVNGQAVSLVGRVCMDQCLLDVSEVPAVCEGMTVTVFGNDGDAALPVEEIAAAAGFINYELVCLVSKRVPRVFYRGEQAVEIHDYVL